MTTIDLSAARPTHPRPTLEALPRRVALTLAELRFVAEAAGGAPLPFDTTDVTAAAKASGLAGRLDDAASRGPSAYDEALRTLHEPSDSLTRRGLLSAGSVDANLLGAVGLLAKPELALELDIAVPGSQVKSWHRQAGDAVATLSTADGIVFELAWFSVEQWGAELSRVAVLPDELQLATSGVPDELFVPFDLANAGGEALRTGRADLLAVLLSRAESPVLAGEQTLNDASAIAAISALHAEAQGRLRVLAARVDQGDNLGVGVLSWVLLADGWHAVSAQVPIATGPAGAGGATAEPVIAVRRVGPADLAADLAPLLAEVNR